MSDRDQKVVDCRNVNKLYPTTTGDIHALEDVSASFSAGRVGAVIGPSGSGKSSLLRIIAGLDRPTDGSVEVGDGWISEMGATRRRRFRRRHVRYVFQRPSDNLISYLTVHDHMRLAAEIAGETDDDRIDEVLESIGIAHRRANKPDELSGGEQQRLAFAQAIVDRPLVIVADEPTAELDAATTEATVALMGALTADDVTALIVATHDPRVAEIAGDKVELERGRRIS
ncbi:MAG: ATP-binding cassette domain-containing protein [Actinomycetota bacterium]